MSMMNRRSFFHATVVVAAGASLAACSSESGATAGPEPSTNPKDQRRIFPQGVASGDPKPESIVLWTRVAPSGKSVPVSYVVAKDKALKEVVADGEVDADGSSDFAVKLKVEQLEPGTKYFYRFTAENVSSVIGETKTAPTADADVPLRFAFATCQDFVGREYYAWQALLDETKDAPLDFIVFLGDYIYEYDGDPSAQTFATERKIELPDGIELPGNKVAQTLEDYRALYKQYRSDEKLQEVHRRYPFVIIWDDHEFGNDCWGDHTNHFEGANGEETVPAQREAADRAWSEYQPTEVEYDENASYPNDIKIYRNLRFGKHLELFMTDQRYYRDDHVILEGPLNADVAKVITNSEIGSRIFVMKKGFDPLEAAAKPTMLGSEQKDWFVSSVKASDATWKVWGSEVQLAQMVADLSSFTTLPAQFQDRFYLTVDQWDGYRTERAEILSALQDVDNLVVIVGDIHASYAAHLYADFDAPSATPAAVEYTISGISSFAVAPAAGAVIGANPLLTAVGLLDLIPQWDDLLKAASPHYQYARSTLNGVAIADLTAERIEVTFVHVADPTLDNYEIVERARFRTNAGTKSIELL